MSFAKLECTAAKCCDAVRWMNAPHCVCTPAGKIREHADMGWRQRLVPDRLPVIDHIPRMCRHRKQPTFTNSLAQSVQNGFTATLEISE